MTASSPNTAAHTSGESLDRAALDQVFTHARTVTHWLDKPVSEDQVKALYDLTRMGPTSANCSPARFVFVTSESEKAKLAACAEVSNRPKIMTAPVTAIIGYDMDFADHMATLFPHNLDAATWFDDPAVRLETAFRNSSLQGAYMMLAARSLGLDCGPMSGFDQAAVTATFFAGTSVKANFICTMGYGDKSRLHPRSPRLDFDAACAIL